MPGKQMAIDADLGAGLINEKEARERRKAIQRDADFHGAMDGASKFVRADAIGDGLVAQIPALLVSTGAALLTTRGDDAELGRALSGQLLTRKRPLQVTAAMLGTIGLLPGMPHILFLALGGIAGWASSKAKDGKQAPADAPAAKAADPKKPDERAHRGELEATLPVDLLGLEVGL